MQASELKPGQFFEFNGYRCICICVHEHSVQFACIPRKGYAAETNLCTRGAQVTPLAVTGWDEPQAVEPKSDKPSIAKELNIDAGTEQFELARALHRVVRAMHDGHCPKCGYLASSMEFEPSEGYHVCPECLFAITKEEADEALAMFLPYMQKNYDKFVAWQLHGRFVKPQPQSELIPHWTDQLDAYGNPLLSDEVPAEIAAYKQTQEPQPDYTCICAVCKRQFQSPSKHSVYCGCHALAQEPQPDAEIPIELLRYGPPPFKRPTLDDLDDLEDAMIESIDGMSKEEIEAELREAGIDMAPAIAKLHAMIDAKKAEQAQPDSDGWIEHDGGEWKGEREPSGFACPACGIDYSQHSGLALLCACNHTNAKAALSLANQRDELCAQLTTSQSEAIAANQQVLVLAAANERLVEQNNNLCLLVVRLARRVRSFEKGSDVATKALDYLSRNGLMPSVLREENK